MAASAAPQSSLAMGHIVLFQAEQLVDRKKEKKGKRLLSHEAL